MRTLKYAILGLLMQSPMTGYDISKAFGVGLGSFWSAKHSQIYPELKRLAEEGLIRYSTVIQGEKLEKKLYEITPSGKQDFLAWLDQDQPLDPTPKDVFRLRSYYSQWLSEEAYLELLQKQIENLLPCDGVQPAGDLVQHQQLRVMGQGGGQVQLGLHSF